MSQKWIFAWFYHSILHPFSILPDILLAHLSIFIVDKWLYASMTFKNYKRSKKKGPHESKIYWKKQIKNEWQKYCHSPWNSLCPRNPANEITRNRTDICHYKPIVILWVTFFFKGSFYNDRRLTTNVCNFKSSEDNTRAHQWFNRG